MTTQKRNRRGGVWLRSAIAAVAVLGVGAGITTAMWSNQVMFEADAVAISMQGRWEDSQEFVDGTARLGQPLVFEREGQWFNPTVYVKNTSDVEVQLQKLNVDNGGLNVIVPAGIDGYRLAAGEAVPIRLTVHAADGTPANLNTTIRIPIQAVKA